jgi:glycerol-3-phosphate dehydrogenase
MEGGEDIVRPIIAYSTKNIYANGDDEVRNASTRDGMIDFHGENKDTFVCVVGPSKSRYRSSAANVVWTECGAECGVRRHPVHMARMKPVAG